jgi:hypothetical protein
MMYDARVEHCVLWCVLYMLSSRTFVLYSGGTPEPSRYVLPRDVFRVTGDEILVRIGVARHNNFAVKFICKCFTLIIVWIALFCYITHSIELTIPKLFLPYYTTTLTLHICSQFCYTCPCSWCCFNYGFKRKSRMTTQNAKWINQTKTRMWYS